MAGIIYTDMKQKIADLNTLAEIAEKGLTITEHFLELETEIVAAKTDLEQVTSSYLGYIQHNYVTPAIDYYNDLPYEYKVAIVVGGVMAAGALSYGAYYGVSAYYAHAYAAGQIAAQENAGALVVYEAGQQAGALVVDGVGYANVGEAMDAAYNSGFLEAQLHYATLELSKQLDCKLAKGMMIHIKHIHDSLSDNRVTEAMDYIHEHGDACKYITSKLHALTDLYNEYQSTFGE